MKIPVTSDTIRRVEQNDVEAVQILLSVLYHFHLHLKTENVSKEVTPAKTIVLEPIRSNSPKIETNVVKMNPKAVSILCENEDDLYSGKIPSLKLFCSILGAAEPNPGVRYIALPNVARDLISAAIDNMDDIDEIASKLAEKVNLSQITAKEIRVYQCIRIKSSL